jgi:hypothetical protein
MLREFSLRLQNSILRGRVAKFGDFSVVIFVILDPYVYQQNAAKGKTKTTRKTTVDRIFLWAGRVSYSTFELRGHLNRMGTETRSMYQSSESTPTTLQSSQSMTVSPVLTRVPKL